MATRKKTVVSEVATAFGAAAARVENLTAKRTAAGAKHTKAQVAVPANAAEAEVLVPKMSEREEVELVAYLHSEARGFQGGSQEEDWVRAEQEVRQRRSQKS